MMRARPAAMPPTARVAMKEGIRSLTCAMPEMRPATVPVSVARTKAR
jgi:hypothetical protein